jgi:ribosomal protein S18 acetylase RimI-like enzyme
MTAQIIEMPSARSWVTDHLTSLTKTKSLYNKLLVIHDASFTGVERPPEPLFRQMYLSADVFVSYIDGEPVGVAIVIDRASEPYLWTIAVNPEHRRMGVGERLLREISGVFKTTELTCKIDNPAQKLYYDNGYRVTGVARGYYGIEGDGLMMRRGETNGN